MSIIRNLTIEQIKEIWREYYKTDFSDLNHDVINIIFNNLDRYSQRQFKQINRELYYDKELIVKTPTFKFKNTDYFKYLENKKIEYKDGIVTFENIKFTLNKMIDLYPFKLNDEFIILSDDKFINKNIEKDFESNITNIITIDFYKIIIFFTEKSIYLYDGNVLIEAKAITKISKLTFFNFGYLSKERNDNKRSVISFFIYLTDDPIIDDPIIVMYNYDFKIKINNIQSYSRITFKKENFTIRERVDIYTILHNIWAFNGDQKFLEDDDYLEKARSLSDNIDKKIGYKL